jgi:hypothetical protein
MHAVFESTPVSSEKRDSAVALHALQHVEGRHSQLESGEGRVGFWKKHGAGLFDLFCNCAAWIVAMDSRVLDSTLDSDHWHITEVQTAGA